MFYKRSGSPDKVYSAPEHLSNMRQSFHNQIRLSPSRSHPTHLGWSNICKQGRKGSVALSGASLRALQAPKLTWRTCSFRRCLNQSASNASQDMVCT